MNWGQKCFDFITWMTSVGMIADSMCHFEQLEGAGMLSNLNFSQLHRKPYKCCASSVIRCESVWMNLHRPNIHVFYCDCEWPGTDWIRCLTLSIGVVRIHKYRIIFTWRIGLTVLVYRNVFNRNVSCQTTNTGISRIVNLIFSFVHSINDIYIYG